jgi:nucleotide-binding universal stress UspA family protein
MYKKMLVPLDGSKLAEVVLGYAKELAGRLDLDVILFHVRRPEEAEKDPIHRSYIDRMAESIKLQSREVQKETRAKPGIKAVEAWAELAVGYPAEEILRYADNNNIDLILLATHGRSGVKRWAMGSVADKVLSTSKIPVWLVRADIPEEIVHDAWPRRTILVPLDGSGLAESVIPHVEALAKQRGTELVEVILLRVCYPPEISSDYPEASMPLSWEEHVKHEMAWAKQGCEQYLADVQRRLKDLGLNVRSEVLMGKPADEIIKYVSENSINLIVMATHGRSGLSRWAYGSTADKILHGAASPIFLVRPH